MLSALPSVTIWVCDNCGNFYASSNAGNLHQQWNTDKKGEKTHRRSRCPTHACAQQDIHRRPYVVALSDMFPILEGGDA